MLVTHYTSPTVRVNSSAYTEEKAKAERAAQVLRNQGRGGHVRWDDNYDDYAAQGRFVVTGR